MPDTKEILASMLKENTGRHFLDSGGAYGRHWQRNQVRDFDAEPESVIEFHVYRHGEAPQADILVTHNVYHWLEKRLSYDEGWDKRFHRWASLPGNQDEGWLSLMEGWVTRNIEKGRFDEETYGGGSAPSTTNTYNGEELLSQVLQFTEFRIDGRDFVLLQIHGGADVRGGYTAPRVFEVIEEAGMYDVARGSIGCKCGAYWTTDDGSHWYAEGSCGHGAGTQLEAYDVKEIETPADWEAGKLCIQSDERIGLCPKCGEKLSSGMY